MAPSDRKHGGNKMCPHRLCASRCKNAPHVPSVNELSPPSQMCRAALQGHPPPRSSLQGYSFVAPSILFDHNNAVMADVLQAPGAGYRPGRAAVARSAMMQVGWPGVEVLLALLESSGLGDSGLVPPVAGGMIWV